ncbi:MAG: PEP-CTERM sorting domain-containing protein [Isosphaeraceae bacterium]
MTTTARIPLAAMVSCLILALPAAADPILYSGSDPGVGPGGARPNSNAAAANFGAAAALLGPVNLINCESLPLGTFTNLVAAPGVTITSQNNAAGVVTGDDVILGYNTTAGGSRFLQDSATGDPSGFNFTFATPIQAWGAYFTGVGTSSGTVTIRFNDGTARSYTVAGSTSGGVQFWGFTDAGRSISSVSALLVGGTGDVWGLDDIRFVAVPEPASVLMAGMGLACVGWIARRRSPGQGC